MLPSGAQEKLERGLDALPFVVSAAERAQFVRYLDLLNKWNQVHNLTAVRDAEEQVSRHVLDCLAVLPYIEDAATLADIGSGAGLPALMLAIMRPQLVVTALESNGKKAAFIREAVSHSGWKTGRHRRKRSSSAAHSPPPTASLHLRRIWATPTAAGY